MAYQQKNLLKYYLKSVSNRILVKTYVVLNRGIYKIKSEVHYDTTSNTTFSKSSFAILEFTFGYVYTILHILTNVFRTFSSIFILIKYIWVRSNIYDTKMLAKM